jgi:hypothetical protein
MGIFSNHSPDEFKGKEAKAIVNMDPADVDLDFFTKYKDNEILKAFTEDQKQAIQFLIDLKGDKYALFMRMGKKSSTHMPAPHAAPHAPVPAPENKNPTLKSKIPLTPRSALPLDDMQKGGRKTRSKKKKGGKKNQKTLINKIKITKRDRLMAVSGYA